MNKVILNLLIVFIIQKKSQWIYAENLRCQKIDFNRPTSVLNEFEECVGWMPVLKINSYSGTTIQPFRPDSEFYLTPTNEGLSCLQSTSLFTLDENSEIRTAIYLSLVTAREWVDILIFDTDDGQVDVVVSLEESNDWMAYSTKINRKIDLARVEIRVNMNTNSSLAIEYIYILNSALPNEECKVGTEIGTEYPTEDPIEDPTEDPTGDTEDPTEYTEDPTEDTEDPTEYTEDPTEHTEDPTEDTEDPKEETEDPTENTKDPTEYTEDPTEYTEDPTEYTEDPMKDSEDPTEDTEDPTVDPTEDTKDPTVDPTENTEDPTEDGTEDQTEDPKEDVTQDPTEDTGTTSDTSSEPPTAVTSIFLSPQIDGTYIWIILSVLFLVTTVVTVIALAYFAWLYLNVMSVNSKLVSVNDKLSTNLPRLIVMNSVDGEHVIVGIEKRNR